MNTHIRMKRRRLIGFVILLGMMFCACQGQQQAEMAHGQADKEMVESAQSTEVATDTTQESMPESELENMPESELKTGAEGTAELTWEDHPWEMKPGEVTMENLLVTALNPVGQTMYIWGGGWNEEDTGAGPDATRLGVSPLWAEFAAKQTAEYDYHDYKYEIHKGLDCSGYIGWLVYNLFETKDGQEGYVMKSSLMAENFAQRGWGTYTPADQVTDWQLGDIMSMDGHVWMSLGTCEDGSVLILHSSVTGVSVCGTSLLEGEDSKAVKLAREFMSTYYPDWYERYPDCSRPASYLTKSGQFRWDEKTLTDTWNLKAMSAEDLLTYLGEKYLAK